eukprot:11379530-Alexandrium_andersonii.AAC.1
MSASLVGSEMCIRDRGRVIGTAARWSGRVIGPTARWSGESSRVFGVAVSYTHLTLPTICSV